MIYFTLLIACFVFLIFLVFFDVDFAIVPSFLLAILLAMPFISYMNHCNDLGTIHAQVEVVKVYEQRVTDLNEQLTTMVPKGKQDNSILLNADSPVRGIIESISKANDDLANARVQIANAKVSIKKREMGMFSFIVKWKGEK